MLKDFSGPPRLIVKTPQGRFFPRLVLLGNANYGLSFSRANKGLLLCPIQKLPLSAITEVSVIIMPIHLAMPMPVCDGSWNLRLVLYQETNEGWHRPPMVKGKMLISQIRIKKIRKDF